MKAIIFQCYFLTCSWGEPKRATDEKWKCKWELVLNMFSFWLINHCHRLKGLLHYYLYLLVWHLPSVRHHLWGNRCTRFTGYDLEHAGHTLKHFGDFVSKVYLKGFNSCKSQKSFTGSRYFLQIVLDLNCCRLFFSKDNWHDHAVFSFCVFNKCF